MAATAAMLVRKHNQPPLTSTNPDFALPAFPPLAWVPRRYLPKRQRPADGAAMRIHRVKVAAREAAEDTLRATAMAKGEVRGEEMPVKATSRADCKQQAAAADAAWMWQLTAATAVTEQAATPEDQVVPADQPQPVPQEPMAAMALPASTGDPWEATAAMAAQRAFVAPAPLQ